MTTPKSEYAKELDRLRTERYRKANPEKVRASQYAWRARNYEKFQAIERNYVLKKKYGITSSEWQSMLESQENRCLICRTSEPTGKQPWHTDHCHATGKVRGIICQPCNIMLGGAKDNISTLQSAVAYLQKFL